MDFIGDLRNIANMSDIQEAAKYLLGVNLHENQRSVSVTKERGTKDESEHLQVSIGATMPTGFEQTAVGEIKEKLGS